MRPLVAAERQLANTLLGTEIPAAALAPHGEGWLGRVKAYWTDGTTWRGMAYLLARFPLGTLTFTIAVAGYGAALYLIAAPIVAPLDPIELGIWQPDSVLDAWPWCRSGSCSWSPQAGSRRAWPPSRAPWPAGAPIEHPSDPSATDGSGGVTR